MSDTKESTIHLTGISTREMANDVLSISFATEFAGNDTIKLQDQLREAVYKALEVIRPMLKDGEVEVKTDAFAVSPRYTSAGKLKDYIARAGIVVKGTDTAKISKLASEIKTMAISDTKNSLSRRAREAVENELTSEAIADFSSKADAAAEAFGYKSWTLGSVNIDVGNSRGGSGKMFALGASAEFGGSAMQVEGGKSELNASVRGTIVLKKK